MNNWTKNIKKSCRYWLLLLLLPFSSYGQDLVIDMAAVDGVELRPGNVLAFRVHNRSSSTIQAEVNGRIQYRRSALSFSYHFSTSLHPGINTFEQYANSAAWTFSDAPLKELFFTYGKLPQGTYEYCVKVQPKQPGGELTPLNDPDACVYYTVEDLFLINLVDPEDDAKLYEFHPMLSWAVNYPFASELTYRLRVAERKSGQNKQNAITRNNPMYQDNRVLNTSAVYPATGRPLQLWQPYVWAVDAYYKGILLGGSEVWQFTIIEDSVLKPVAADQSYYEFEQHHGDTRLQAIGALKLKYISEANADTLHFRLFDRKGTEVRVNTSPVALLPGDNRIIFQIQDKINLVHKADYTLQLDLADSKQFIIPFTYINPLFIQQNEAGNNR